MKSFTYRITLAHSPTIAKIAGSVKGESLDDAFDKIIKRNKITIKNEYYDDDSMMAGSIWRTSFIMNDKAVSVAISPQASSYK